MLKKGWFLAVVLFAFACGADSGTETVPDADAVSSDEVEVAGGEVQIEVAPELTADLEPDPGGFEEVIDLEEQELPPVDDFGEPCGEDDDCEFGVCIDTAEGKVCTKECEDQCPGGFVCVLVDAAMVCMPEFLNLCKPCQGDEDCAGPEWDGAYRCASYGVDGDFCAAECQSGDDCPAGYKCGETFSRGGDLVTACVRQIGGCECNAYFVAAGAATSCVNANEWGSCEGERVCEDGGLSPCDGAQPEQEECDLVDNDCDGEVDEKLSAGACTLENDFGVCTGEAVCVEGEYECQGQLPIEEECDGLDNDCDGQIDEEFEDENGDGTPDCLESDVDDDGVFDYQDNCVDVPNPLQEDLDDDGEGDACDADDDGDGSLDVEDCEPLDSDIHPGAEEKCNLIDDDCDDEVDEDFPDTNDDGIPDCISDDDDGDGVPDVDDNCPSDSNPDQENFDEDGAGDACDLDDDNDQVLDADDCQPLNPGIYPGAVEECDGVDNNCNDQVDEGFEPIECGLGACEHTIDACLDGVLQWCDPMEGADAEACDGVDNDCDGEVDQGLGQTSCGIGPCEHSVDNCAGGEVQVCDPLAGAEDEICDGVDNNCDGDIDEGTGGNDCTIENDVGVCAGTNLCVDGQLVCDAAVPAPDDCDGLDNDCDGEVDEELGQTSCGFGECLHTVDHCVGGENQVCDPLEGAVEESCDGLDNDCDEDVDEDLGATSCGLGVCEHSIDNCVDAEVQVCDAMEGAGLEECDGLDNNCDGVVDDGLGETTCGLGECEHTIDNCAGGEEQVCDPMQGSADEECDGLDNDCNGEVDEAFADFDLDGVADCVDDDDDGDGDLDDLDCEPLNPDVGPSQAEICFNEIDEDCTGDTPDACVLIDCLAILDANADLPDGPYTIDADGDGPAEPAVVAGP